MEKMGSSLDRAMRQFQDLMGTRTRQLEKPVNKIIELQQSAVLEPDAGQLSLPDGDEDE